MKKFEITKKRCLYRWKACNCKIFENWKEDALRRDFTINSIYSDSYGNLLDPFNAKDIEDGIINFVGNPEKRIKEDYLRIRGISDSSKLF